MYMINELVREIVGCLKSGYYMAALTTALTLPDICGKAESPELEKKTKLRYINWYNKYIGEPEKERFMNFGEFYQNGELVYSLRCSLLHQGNPNIEDKISDKNRIVYFELLYQKEEGARICMGTSESQLIKVDAEEKSVNIKYCINIKLLCYKLCKAASEYYRKNKEKFDFFNYRVVWCDFQTRRDLLGNMDEDYFDYKNQDGELKLDLLYQMACED